MSEGMLKDRMARAIAAVIHRSLGDGGEDPKHAVMGDRRKVAENAAVATLATIRLHDTLGNGLIVVDEATASKLDVSGESAETSSR